MLGILHRRANGSRFRKLAACRFNLSAYAAADGERCTLTMLRGRLRLSFRVTALLPSDDNMLRGVPLPLPVVRRLTSPAYVRKSARTSGFGFGLEALDEPEP